VSSSLGLVAGSKRRLRDPPNQKSIPLEEKNLIVEYLKPKRFLTIVLRLSLVVALIASSIDTFKIYDRWTDESVDRQFATATMDCAIKLPRERIESVRNEYGLFDVAPLGCGAGTDGVHFWVSNEELQQHRDGKYFSPLSHQPSEFLSVLITFAQYFFSVNLFGIVLVAAIAVGRWIIGNSAR